MRGEPVPAISAAEQGRDLADALDDRFFSRNCRAWLSTALMIQGNLDHAAKVARSVTEEAEAVGDLTMAVFSYVSLSEVLGFHGQADAAHAAAQSALAAATTMGGYFADAVYSAFANDALARGDAAAARKAAETALQQTNPLREVFTRSVAPLPEA